MSNDSEMELIGNIEIHKKEGYVVVLVNPKIYPIDVVYSACYVFIDRAYVVLGGNPDEEINVELRPRQGKEGLEILGREFNNELLKYAVYKIHAEKSSDIRKRVVEKALETNCGITPATDKPDLDDPLGIAKPWEETHKDG